MTARSGDERRAGPDFWVTASRLTLAGIFALALLLAIARIANLLSN